MERRPADCGRWGIWLAVLVAIGAGCGPVPVGQHPAADVTYEGELPQILPFYCDGSDPQVFPGAPELCDGRDNDCDGWVPADEVDADGDGFRACSDCDDADPEVSPDALEVCDGVDTDCDGWTPPGDADADGDGVLGCQGDCDDADPTVFVGAPELCDGLDNDCNGWMPLDEVDGDADGAPLCEDCDDADPSRYPTAVEVCDGVDQNCDGVTGLVQEPKPRTTPSTTWSDPFLYRGNLYLAERSATLLGFGFHTEVGEPTTLLFRVLEGGAPGGAFSTVHTAQVPIEPMGPTTYFTPAMSLSLVPGTYYALVAEPLDGAVPDYQGAYWSAPAPVSFGQLLGGVLSNGTTVSSTPSSRPRGIPMILGPDEDDSDGDGFLACADDCDDEEAAVHPGAPETCDGMDSDCDGSVPVAEVDSDEDGHPACSDCDDAVTTAHPGAPEICDGVDSDCDGVLLPAEAIDADGDGIGQCLDCDDADALSVCDFHLLAWAEGVADAARSPGTRGWLEAEAAAATLNCATQTSTPPATPPFLPAAWTGPLLPPLSIQEDARSGPCSGTSSLSGGSVTFGTAGATGCGPTAWCEYDSVWLTGEELSLDVGGDSVTLDGSLWEVEDNFDSWGPCDGRLWDFHTYRGAEAVVSIGPNVAPSSALLGPGVSALDFAWESSETYVPNGFGCQDAYYASLSGTVTWNADSTPWTFAADLAWSWQPWWIFLYCGSGGVPVPPVGCPIEPTSGTLTLTQADSLGAPPNITVEVTFDGATSCDGCGQLTVDGVPSGSWCPETGFESP